MTTKLLTAALCLALLLAVAGFTYRAPRFEYLTAPVTDADEDRTLKNLGAGGWELVAVRESPAGGRVLYLKRAL